MIRALPRTAPRAAAAVAIVLVLAAAAACGRKSPPLAPETVQPLPPTGLVASVTPQGVKISWRRPTRTSGGRSLDDLDRFLVERARGDEPFAVVHVFPVEDRERFQREPRLEWLDTTAGPGVRWRYRVIAVTLDGYRSPPAGPVEVAATPPATEGGTRPGADGPARPR